MLAQAAHGTNGSRRHPDGGRYCNTSLRGAWPIRFRGLTLPGTTRPNHEDHSTEGCSVTSADYQGASPADIRHHYDIGNDFYALWLDETLSYSCALWEASCDTLQDAQERKIDYLAREARAIGA